jgi:hypothetical protein
MIVLGAVGAFIGLLGIFFFRGYHHDHNIGHEIGEQKKNDFVRSVYATLRNRDINNENSEHPLIEQRSISAPQPLIIPELIVTESTTNTHQNNNNEQRKKRQLEHDSILPSLNEAYQNSFIVSETTQQVKEERISDPSEQQLRVPDRTSVQFSRMRSKSSDSAMSSTFTLNQVGSDSDDDFQKSRVFATLHALSLHSLVNI